MKRDLLNPAPGVWREQDELAAKVARAASKAQKGQIVTLLCASLMKMTEKPRYRRPI
jgi:hypothetical protein